MSESKIEPDLPLDDFEYDLVHLRALRGASSISDEAYRKISKARSNSKSKLAKSLSEYWAGALPGAANVEEQLQQLDPLDITLRFEAYVEQLLNAYAQELIPLFSDGDTFSARLERDVLNMILRHIKRAHRPAVPVDLGEWRCQFGLWEDSVTDSFEDHLLMKYVDPSPYQSSDSFTKYRFYFRNAEMWRRFTKRVKAKLRDRAFELREEADRYYAEHPAPKTEPEELPDPQPGKALPEALATAVDFSGESAEDRKIRVILFLRKCHAECSDIKFWKRHIWMLVGHTNGRQFQYWQSRDEMANQSDEDNFNRILNLSPTEFVKALRAKGLISG